MALADHADEDFCYLTTTGRRSGNPHEIEIWFGLANGRLYLMAGDPDSDWVKNVRAEPRVHVRIADEDHGARGRVVEDADEDAMVRRLLAAKYQGWREGKRLSSWARSAQPVAIEFS